MSFAKTCESVCGKCSPWALAFLRIVTGLIFLYHGWPKLFGEKEMMVAFFASTGLPAPELMLTLSGLIEVVGGTLLILGLFARYAAFVAALQFIVIIVFIKLKMGWGSLEFDLILFAALTVMMCGAEGALSLDKIFGTSFGMKGKSSQGGSDAEAMTGR